MTEHRGLSDYLQLTKPRLSLLSVLTTMAAYASARVPHEPRRWLWVFVGTSLAAFGVAALNQYLEADTDAHMRRTADRPLPAGRIPTGSAFVLGGLMCIFALMLMYAMVSAIAALFTLLTIVAYLGWYTPAKRRSRFSTEIGAIAGALPCLIGWTAGADNLAALGWIQFGILLFWQIPHFMAIAWTYRGDYSAVHFPMLSVRDPSGRSVAAWSFVATALLVMVSLLPVCLRLDTWRYAAIAALAGGWILVKAAAFLRPADRDRTARSLFHVTLAYLPIVLGALVLDRALFFAV
ncbi:MAG TPA: heme o synthase [Opitutaceae bacterium]